VVAGGEAEVDVVCIGDWAGVDVDELVLAATTLTVERELELLTDDETGESLYIWSLFPAPQYSY
jgi:hypothetical protein